MKALLAAMITCRGRRPPPLAMPGEEVVGNGEWERRDVWEAWRSPGEE